MIGSEFNDKFLAIGGNDLLNGRDGADLLKGGAGNDTLLGGKGPDRIYGDSGSDNIRGGAWRDFIHGGSGKDVLFGDSGSDTFAFTSVEESRSSRVDKISDFSRADDDVIRLSAIDASARKHGNQSFRYIGEAEFSAEGRDSAGELRYEDLAGRRVHVEADLNGDGRADIKILVAGVFELLVSDFVL